VAINPRPPAPPEAQEVTNLTRTPPSFGARDAMIDQRRSKITKTIRCS